MPLNLKIINPEDNRKKIKEITMIKVVDSKNYDAIPMCEMLPLEIGVIQDDLEYEGNLVMRTASKDKFEVMRITNAAADRCWTGKPRIKVKLLPNDQIVKIELCNK